MLQTFLSYLIIYGLQNNIVVASGAGLLQFQREKMYKSFRLVQTILLIIGVIIVSCSCYMLENYVFAKLDMSFLTISVAVLLTTIYHLIMASTWHKRSSFKYYLYENSYSYAMDVVFTLAVVFTLDMSLSILDFAMCLAAIILVIFIINMLFGFFIEDLSRGYMNKYFVNVPARLFLFAIISILLYYASLLV